MNINRAPFIVAIALAASLAPSPRSIVQTTRPAPPIKVTIDRASGIYSVGETATFTVTLPPDATAYPVHFRVTENNLKTLQEGTLAAGQSTATLSAKLDEPGWMYVIVGDEKAEPPASAGVIVAPAQIEPSSKAPDDFDAFWKTQIAEIEKVPANAQLTPGDSENPKVDFFDVTLDNVDDAKVHAQLARPKAGEKSPAIVVFQYAGVYPLSKTIVTSLAKDGWLALNVMAHDLPLHEDKSFYADLTKPGASLANYFAIGNQSRDTSYFRHMFLGDYQAIEWLRTRPDWDGKVLVVRGESQGGMQSIALAGLDPHVTELIASVPAGCDTLSQTAGRMPAWPNWQRQSADEATKKRIMDTSRYYDSANFAPHVKCPAMISVALRDVIACPPSVIATCNAVAGPHELIVMPQGTHTDNHQQSVQRVADWDASLLKAGEPPKFPADAAK